MVRVLFFYPNNFLGPVMSVFAHIIRNLDPTRVEAHLAVHTRAEGQLPVTEAQARIRRYDFGTGLGRGTVSERLKTAAGLPPAMLQVAAEVYRRSIDVIQCASTPYAGSLAFLLAKLCRRPLLVHFHDLFGRYSGGLGEHSFLRRQSGSAFARYADQLVAVSNFVAEQAIAAGLPRHKMQVVLNGVNLTRFSPSVDGAAMRAEYGIAKDEVLVLQLARVLQSKRQEDFVRAFALAHKKVSKLRGLIVGWEDPRYHGSFKSYRDELDHLRQQAGLGDAFRIAAPRPEAPQLMAAADVVVMPSVDDPCPLVVTEAMAAGKPVVGVRSGGIPEMVQDHQTGLLANPKDPEDLAEKLAALGTDAALRQRMGEAGRRRAEEHFDEARLAAQFTPLYERLAAR